MKQVDGGLEIGDGLEDTVFEAPPISLAGKPSTLGGVVIEVGASVFVGSNSSSVVPLSLEKEAAARRRERKRKAQRESKT